MCGWVHWAETIGQCFARAAQYFLIEVLLDFVILRQCLHPHSFIDSGKVSIIRKAADILFAFAFQILIFEVRD